IGDLLAECDTREATSHHHVERLFGLADRTHAVMNAAGPKPDLRDLEAPAFAKQDVLLRHAHIVEADVHVPTWRVIMAEHLHRFDDLDAGRVSRNEDLRLLSARRSIGIGFHHHNHDLATRIASAGDVVFLAVDYVRVAFEPRGG